MNGFEFTHGSHASQLQGIVFIGPSLDVGPLPCVFVGGADECFEAETLSQVVDPTGRPASFHDDQIDFVLVLLEDGGEVVSIGSGIEERMFASFGVIKAAHGIEFAEVESENLHDYSALGLGLGLDNCD